MIAEAMRLPGGGISKVNIATDLELATLGALGREERMTDAECRALPLADLERARAAVEQTVVDKIENFVRSGGRARGDQ
jgi:fructose-bisphosphate aldolase class II